MQISAMHSGFRFAHRIALLVLLGAATPAWPASPESQLALAKAAYKLQDYAGALQLFRGAAEAGEPAAMAGLGGLYALGAGTPANDREAIRWFKKAAAL